VRIYALFFVPVAVVLLLQFLVYTLRGGGSFWISAALFVSFLFCLIPSVYFLSPFRRPTGTPRNDWRRRPPKE